MNSNTPNPRGVSTGPALPGAPLSQPSTLNSQPAHIPDHELLRCIGRGSYGEVWLARNIVGTLRAVKIVQRQTFERDEHFEREFKGMQKFEPISRSHEGLVDILQIGRSDAEGYFYYVMELADSGESVISVQCSVISNRSPTGSQSQGEAKPLNTEHWILNTTSYQPRTLRSELQQHGRLPVGECVRIALALTDALHALHEKGLLHRDIKPSNIIFVDGVPKLADIGLVADASEAKSLVGTVGYIPPEGPGSAQADLYSLGKVLYELVTGKDRQDFPGLPPEFREQLGTSQTCRSRRKEAHSSKSEIRPAAPGAERGENQKSEMDHRLLASAPTNPRALPFTEFNEILLKACESDPRHRYASARALHDDLALLQRGQSVIGKQTRAHRLKLASQVGLASASILVLVACGWLLSTRFNASTLQRFNASTLQRFNPSGPPEVNSIAVLPFFNEATNSTAPDYLCNALAQETMNALTNSPGLRGAPRAAILPFKGTTNDLRRVGTQLGVRTVLAGGFLRNSNSMRVAARLLNVADGAELWFTKLEREREEFPLLGADVARQAASALNVQIGERAIERLQVNLARTLRADGLHQRAMSFPANTKAGLNQRFDLLNQAVLEDANYAQAYADLADAYVEANEVALPPAQAMPEARKNAMRALLLEPSLATAHVALGGVLFHYDWDVPKAEAHFKRAIELDPQSAWPCANYASLLLSLSRFEEAERILKQGEKLEPQAQIVLSVWCWRYFADHHFDEQLRASERLLAVHSNDFAGLMHHAWALERLGHLDKALVEARSLVALDAAPDTLAFLGFVHARMGRRSEAEKMLERLKEMHETSYVSGFFPAQIWVGLGENDQALACFEQAVQQRSGRVINQMNDPRLDPLRGDPRFIALLTRLSQLEGVRLRKSLQIKGWLSKVCSHFPALLLP